MNKDARDRFIINAMMYLMSEQKSVLTKVRLMQAGSKLLYGLERQDESCNQCARYSTVSFFEFCPICGRSLV